MIHDLTINLYNVPFDKSYSNLFNFSTKAELFTYFNNNFLITAVSNMNYQRKDGYCMIEKTMQDLQKVNYISYFVDGMRYFAFVDNKSFVNPKTTRLELTTDLFHTFFEHFEYPVCYIERRIQNTDGEKVNLVPEDNLQIVPTYFEVIKKIGDLSENKKVLFQTSTASKDKLNPDPNDLVVKIFENCGNKHFTQNYLIDYEDANPFIFRFFNETTENGVLNFDFPNFKKGYIVPESPFFVNMRWYSTTELGLLNGNTPQSLRGGIEIPIPNKIQSQYTNNLFTPKNKKLLSHLFRKMYVKVGNEQNLTEIDYSFREFRDVLENDSLLLYNRTLFGDCEPLVSIEFENVPQKNFFTFDNFYELNPMNIGDADHLQNLITNRNNQIMGAISNTLLSIGSVATSSATGGASLVALGGTVSGAISNVQSVINTNTEITNASKKASTHTVSPNSDFFYNSACFNVLFGVPHYETLEKLDVFFTQYGYSQNILSSPTPKYSNRPRFYYVKTKGAKIECPYLSSGELAILENAFNNGIHFWKNNIYNYDDNEVV